MSWYNYAYVGARSADGKLYPVGPFDKDGKLHSAIWASHSFTPEELNDLKYHPNDKDISDELIEALKNEDGEEPEKRLISYIPLADLPSESPLKTGYYLIEDVKAFKKDNADYDDLEYHRLSAEEYLAKLQAEAIAGPPAPQKDVEGYDLPVYSVRDYMPYAYIDYNSIEYWAEKIRNAVAIFDSYDFEEKYGGKPIVIIYEG